MTHDFSAAENGVMPIEITAAAIVVCQETRERGIAAPAAWITCQSETDGRTTTEVDQKAQHNGMYRHISEI